MIDKIVFKRATWQGCTLFPAVLALVMELLARIRQTCNVAGIRVGEREYKASYFADNIFLTLTRQYIYHYQIPYTFLAEIVFCKIEKII